MRSRFGGDGCRGIVGRHGSGGEKGHWGAEGECVENRSRNHGRKDRSLPEAPATQEVWIWRESRGAAGALTDPANLVKIA
jgi:hypothetical protein